MIEIEPRFAGVIVDKVDLVGFTESNFKTERFGVRSISATVLLDTSTQPNDVTEQDLVFAVETSDGRKETLRVLVEFVDRVRVSPKHVVLRPSSDRMTVLIMVQGGNTSENTDDISIQCVEPKEKDSCPHFRIDSIKRRSPRTVVIMASISAHDFRKCEPVEVDRKLLRVSSTVGVGWQRELVVTDNQR